MLYIQLYVLHNILENLKKVKTIDFELTRTYITNGAGKFLSKNPDNDKIEKDYIKQFINDQHKKLETIKENSKEDKRFNEMISKFQKNYPKFSDVEVTAFGNIIEENLTTSDSDFKSFISKDFEKNVKLNVQKVVKSSKFRKIIENETRLEAITTKASKNLDSVGLGLGENKKYFKYSLGILNSLRRKSPWKIIDAIYGFAFAITTFLLVQLVWQTSDADVISKKLASGILKRGEGDLRMYENLINNETSTAVFEKFANELQDNESIEFFTTLETNDYGYEVYKITEKELNPDDFQKLKDLKDYKVSDIETYDFSNYQILSQVPYPRKGLARFFFKSGPITKRGIIEPSKDRSVYIRQQLFAPYLYNKNVIENKNLPPGVIKIAEKMEIAFQKSFQSANPTAEIEGKNVVKNTTKSILLFGDEYAKRYPTAFKYDEILDVVIKNLRSKLERYPVLDGIENSLCVKFAHQSLILLSSYTPEPFSTYFEHDLSLLLTSFDVIEAAAYDTYTDEIDTRLTLLQKSTKMRWFFLFAVLPLVCVLDKLYEKLKRGVPPRIDDDQLSVDSQIERGYNGIADMLAYSNDSVPKEFVKILMQLFKIDDDRRQQTKLMIYIISIIYIAFAKFFPKDVKEFIFSTNKNIKNVTQKGKNPYYDINNQLGPETNWIARSLKHKKRSKTSKTFNIYLKFIQGIAATKLNTPEDVFKLFYEIEKTETGYNFSESQEELVTKLFPEESNISNKVYSKFNREYNALDADNNPFFTFAKLMHEVVIHPKYKI